MKNFNEICFKGTFRTYQQSVLEKFPTYLEDKKINIVASPGSGKTILGLELIKRLNSPAIIFAPTITIRNQWKERFEEAFLPQNENVEDYVSFNLNSVKLINVVTYQGLHSAITKTICVDENGEAINYEKINIFELMRKNGISTICLDEAHHLQNEWQKSLEIFIKGLNSSVFTISLTATPPYDASPDEWQRYESVCGEIDEEIFVPELIKQGSLCPHQDYIYFNYPTTDELNELKTFKNKVETAVAEICKLEFLADLCALVNATSKDDYDELFSNLAGYIGLLALFTLAGLNVNKKLIKTLTLSSAIKINEQIVQNGLNFLLQTDRISEKNKNEIIAILKTYGLYSRKTVCITLTDALKRKIFSSVGKLDSIVEITKSETASLKNDLRMLILTDYIKKEKLSTIGAETQITEISVVDIFEKLRRSMPNATCISALSGGLVILHNSLIPKIEGYDFSTKTLQNTEFCEIIFKNGNKDKVKAVSELFAKGYINILIGTKSLLGEGWDSPCINSLILASFVGSFMLSNQMRGRAIRIDKSHPEKTSNVWHLVTVEPSYVLENNALKRTTQKLFEDYDMLYSCDFEMLMRRFGCFVAPNYTSGEIESGIDRITIIKPPFNEKGIANINSQMLTLSSNRSALKETWQNAISESTKMSVVGEIPKEQKPTVSKPFVFMNLFWIILIVTIDSCIFNSFITQITQINISEIPFIFVLCYAFVMLASVFGIIFLVNKIIFRLNPKNIMTKVADCVLDTLKEIGLISSSASIKVQQSQDLSSFTIMLVSATMHEQNVFNKAISELFSPIDNPRYLIIAKFGNFFNYRHSFACPSRIGENKDYATILAKHLSKKVEHYDVVYTRNENGRKTILTCRKHSFITQNAKVVGSKKKINKWE